METMNLFEELVKSAPVGNRLKFGYNEDVIITKVDIGVRNRKGMDINQNTYITFAKVDPTTKKIVAQSEGSYWNLDHKTDFVIQNFIDQSTSLMTLVQAIRGEEVLGDYEAEVLAPLPDEYETFDGYLKTKEGAKIMQDTISQVTADYLKNHLGDKCPKLKIKVTVNKKGYFQPGSVENWILPVDSEEKLPTITAGERRAYRESMKADDDKPVEPDKVGKAKSEKVVASLKALDGLS